MRDIEISKTNRGFALIKFKDCYGALCSLQKSSLADEDAIWLGCDTVEERNGEHHSIRMHLTKSDACRLISVLEAFVEFGELPDTIAECAPSETGA